MKQLLSFSLGAASALLFVLLPSMSSAEPTPELPGGIRAGSVVYSFNIQKGAGAGFSGLSADSPVTVREIDDNWIRMDYPGKTGGASWVNLNAVISFQVQR